MNRVLLAFYIISLGGVGFAVSREEDKQIIGTFTADELKEWTEKSFTKNTDYQLIGDEEVKVLKAQCTDQASILYRKIDVDLTKTPILNWSWRVDGVHPSLEDATKDGDDYAVRIYVVNGGNSFLPWRAKAINYVWANSQPEGAAWPSAYTKSDMMVATKSGQPLDPEKWNDEKRNVRKDFMNYFGKDFKNIDGVAVMTDCDNSKLPSTGYYKNIWFSAE